MQESIFSVTNVTKYDTDTDLTVCYTSLPPEAKVLKNDAIRAGIAVFLNYFVTIAIFPSFFRSVKRQN